MIDASVRLLDQEDLPALDEFRRENDETTIFHSLAWHQVIEAAYGHQCDFWSAWMGGRIVGIFPVVLVRVPVLGTKMVAMAYQMDSGLPVAASRTIQIRLVEAAIERAEKLEAKFLEIRHREPAPFLEQMGFLSIDSQLVSTSVPIRGLELRQIRRGHRRDIKRAQKQGVKINESVSLADIEKFRRMYLREGREIGAPKPGWVYFEKLHQLLGPNLRLLLAWVDNECLGGALTLDDGRTAHGRHAAYSSPKASALHVGKLLLWHALSAAAERGCCRFNLGITYVGDTGLIKYKAGWNGKTSPVNLYVYPIRSQPKPPGSYFEGFGMAKAIWRKLPLPLVELLGHYITRWVC